MKLSLSSVLGRLRPVPSTGGALLGSAAVLTALLAASGEARAQARTIVDPDSVISFEVPEGWVDADLENPDASVIMSGPEEQAFLMVIVEDKGDLYGWNLTRAEYVTVGQTVGAVDNPEVDEPVRFMLDGSPAVQYVIRGAAGGVQLAYLKVTIDAPTAFVQLIGWTSRSAWSTHRQVLEGIVESTRILREPEGPKGPGTQ